jgi:hypothetical protein
VGREDESNPELKNYIPPTAERLQRIQDISYDVMSRGIETRDWRLTDRENGYSIRFTQTSAPEGDSAQYELTMDEAQDKMNYVFASDAAFMQRGGENPVALDEQQLAMLTTFIEGQLGALVPDEDFQEQAIKAALAELLLERGSNDDSSVIVDQGQRVKITLSHEGSDLVYLVVTIYRQLYDSYQRTRYAASLAPDGESWIYKKYKDKFAGWYDVEPSPEVGERQKQEIFTSQQVDDAMGTSKASDDDFAELESFLENLSQPSL